MDGEVVNDCTRSYAGVADDFRLMRWCGRLPDNAPVFAHLMRNHCVFQLDAPPT